MTNVFNLRRVHLDDQVESGVGVCGRCPSIERLHYEDPAKLAGPIITVLGRINCDESELCDICTALVANLRKTQDRCIADVMVVANLRKEMP